MTNCLNKHFEPMPGYDRYYFRSWTYAHRKQVTDTFYEKTLSFVEKIRKLDKKIRKLGVYVSLYSCFSLLTEKLNSVPSTWVTATGYPLPKTDNGANH